MYFQKAFQQEELPEKNLTSCFFYNTPIDGKYPLHCHSYYEISFVIKGERTELVNGTEYHLRDSELVFIQPLMFHSNSNILPSDIIIIQFSPKLLEVNSSLSGSENLLSRPLNAGARLRAEGKALEVLGDIEEFCREHPDGGTTVADELKRNSIILLLLSAFLESGALVTTNAAGIVTGVPGLDNVINYIIEHPDRRTDMKQAAQIANMSYYAFSRMFKEVVGTNFSDYCNIVRIRLAEELLITTDIPVSEISARVGIDSQSYFSRLFKQINGSSPAEYRANNRSR